MGKNRTVSNASNNHHLERILIADDETDILRIFGLALGKKFRVDAFSNPKEALEHFKQDSSSFALVITDIRMPQMNGFQLASEIRSIRQDIPIIFVSAFEISSEEYAETYPQATAASILSKPVSLSKLMQVASETIKAVK